MSEDLIVESVVYDAARTGFEHLLKDFPRNQQAAVLRQLTEALASMLVERAGGEAENIWFGASLDVRIPRRGGAAAKAPAFRDRARLWAAVLGQAFIGWGGFFLICVAIWAAVLAKVLG